MLNTIWGILSAVAIGGVTFLVCWAIERRARSKEGASVVELVQLESIAEDMEADSLAHASDGNDVAAVALENYAAMIRRTLE